VLRTRRSPRSSGGDRDLRPRADARPRDDDRARYLADGPPGRSASAAIRPEGGLVARSRELAHLDHVLWKARAGSSSAVALRGEPGLGKSALIEATVARSADFSVIRLAGAALEVSGTVPPGWPGPVVELLSAQDPDTLPAPPARTSERRRGARPFVGTVASAAPRMVLAAADALSALQREVRSPLLVAVDDCHVLPAWFSAALAQAVTDHLRDLPVVVLLAWRDTPHLPALELPRGVVTEHCLGGLTRAQAEVLLRHRFGQVPVQAVITALVSATAGNPAALLDASSRLDADQLSGWRPLPEPLPIGDQLAAAFARRLEDLSDDIRRALAAASAGRFPVSVLDAALNELGLGVGILEPAEEAGIVVVRGERIDFVHPLVRAAAFRQVPEEFRKAIHDAVAKVFSAQGRVERSAFHAGQRGGRDDAVARLYTQSARVALDRGEPETAARYEELASDFATDGDASALHLARGAALWLTIGEAQRSQHCIERALRLEPTARVAAEVQYQQARVRATADLSKAVADAMLEAASRCEADMPYRAVVMTGDAVACQLLGACSDDSAHIAHRATELARAVGTHAEALGKATLACAQILEGDDQVPPVDIVAATSLLIGQTQQFAASPHLAYVIGEALLRIGERSHARRWSRWIEDCARSVGDRALSAVPPLLEALDAMGGGRITEVLSHAGAAADIAERCRHDVLLARALGILAQAHAAQGAYDRGYECAARLFAMNSEVGRGPRVQTLVALGALELQRGRPASAIAWLGAADDDAVPRVGPQAAHPAHDTVRATWAPEAAELVLLAGGAYPLSQLLAVVERACTARAVPAGWRPWIAGICEADLDVASGHFEAAALAFRDAPLCRALVELAWATKLAGAGRTEEAQEHFIESMTSFEGLGATGWAKLAEGALATLPAQGPDVGRHLVLHATTNDGHTGADPLGERATGPLHGAEHPRRTRDLQVAAAHAPTEHPRWELMLLGTFELWYLGEVVPLPVSLAAQAVKIVALQRRIPVDELVELLWPEAAPGVGSRRLRNVLWRIRAVAGEVLERDGNFIRIASEALVDVVEFQRLAEQALAHNTPPEKALQLAREALVLYRGELLPGDRYADWAAGHRERFARLHLQLVELLLEDAIRQGRLQEALDRLDDLIGAEPYEERHYLQAAELEAQMGNRRRALSTLDRAERMLADLGVPPSRSLLHIREALTRN